MTITISYLVEEHKQREEITEIVNECSIAKSKQSGIEKEYPEFFVFTANDDDDHLYEPESALKFTNMTSHHLDKPDSNIKFMRTIASCNTNKIIDS